MPIEILSQWRNRLLASSRFRHWIQVFPLTRHIARRKAVSLFRLMNGFVHSQVVLACVELDLLRQVSDQPLPLSDLATLSDVPGSRLEVLLEAAAQLDLLQRYPAVSAAQPTRYGLGASGASLLADPGLVALVRHHRHFYRDMADPVALLRGQSAESELGRLWPYAAGKSNHEIESTSAAAYTALMGQSQRMIAEQVLSGISLDGVSSLLDVGGGNGSFVTAVANRYPGIKLGIFDLPAVISLAGESLKSAAPSIQVTLHPGDFYRQELPSGYSMISLVRILHDHDDEPVMNLLRITREALPAGGRILVAEPMKDEPGAAEMSSVYFGFYLMAMGSGRPRSCQEIRSMLKAAGFDDIEHHATMLPLVCSVITARA